MPRIALTDELEVQRPSAPGWMITFADLLSLLLTFFVMLFATTSVEQKEWHRIVGPISGYFGGSDAGSAGSVVAPVYSTPGHERAYVAALLDHLVAGTDALHEASVVRQGAELVVTLPATAVQPAGRQAALADLGRLLAGLDNRAELVVHHGVDLSPAADPAEAWRNALARAEDLAGEISRLGGGRPVAASAALDLADGIQAERVELIVYDTTTAAGRDHAPG